MQEIGGRTGTDRLTALCHVCRHRPRFAGEGQQPRADSAIWCVDGAHITTGAEVGRGSSEPAISGALDEEGRAFSR